MQRIVNLIEETLDAEVSPAELAAASGYSHWHFLHLFREAVGMPLCRWRTKRRLAHAIWHVSCGLGMTDTALRWGFGTYSGFYRAFWREYGCTPAEFIRTHQVRRPSPPRLEEEEYRMLNRDCFQQALTHWGLDLPLTPVTYPCSGEVSDHAMYAGDDYVLKACRDERTCRMTAALAEALCARGVPASRAVPLPDGALSLPVEGFRLMLCHRLPGEALRTPVLLKEPQQSGERIGRALAGLHLALADMADAWEVDDLDLPGICWSGRIPGRRLPCRRASRRTSPRVSRPCASCPAASSTAIPIRPTSSTRRRGWASSTLSSPCAPAACSIPATPSRRCFPSATGGRTCPGRAPGRCLPGRCWRATTLWPR